MKSCVMSSCTATPLKPTKPKLMARRGNRRKLRVWRIEIKKSQKMARSNLELP